MRLLVILFLAGIANAQVYIQPEQVHLSMGTDQTKMIVTWVTKNVTKASIVEYGTTRQMTNSVVGTANLFTDGGSEHRQMFIHRAIMTIVPGQTYYYHVGSPFEAWSAVFLFKAMPSDDPAFKPTIAMYGDMGNVNSRSMALLQSAVQRGGVDAIFHVGDFAYDMDTNQAQMGDEFMRMIEPIAAYVPYMVSPGNHEQAYNFSNYMNRFTMPGTNNSLWYSYNIGPAHVISFSTEYYFYGWLYGFDSVMAQYNWLVQDLKEANKPENRQQRPWIITLAHRPMYCSTADGDDCTLERGIIRTGLPFYKICGLEDLFLEYGVDFEIWAHEHVYERLWPVYNTTVRNGTDKAGDPYYNPRAPVHIVTGSAGCQEDHDNWIPKPADWSALRSADYGISMMEILNGTHLHVQFYSDDQMKITDDFMITKTSPYPSYYGELSRKHKEGVYEGILKDAPCMALNHHY